jgi:transposase
VYRTRVDDWVCRAHCMCVGRGKRESGLLRKWSSGTALSALPEPLEGVATHAARMSYSDRTIHPGKWRSTPVLSSWTVSRDSTWIFEVRQKAFYLVRLVDLAISRRKSSLDDTLCALARPSML